MESQHAEAMQVSAAVHRTPSTDKTTQTPSCILTSTHISDYNIVAELHNYIIGDDANNLVKLIVGSDIDVNSTFGRSERPILHVAASLGAHDCLCYLIRLGADVDKRDSAGGTAFHLGTANYSHEVEIFGHTCDNTYHNNVNGSMDIQNIPKFR